MAVASYDAQFSFQQDSLARLGDRGVSEKLSEEQQKKFQESPAMIAARKSDELAEQYTNARDNQRMITDTFFRAEDSDWTAPKSYEYKRTVDYYNVLGIEEYATLEEVKAAYKKLSLIYHPDKTKGLPKDQQEEYAKVFITVKNAHLVLSDKPTRRQYDYDRDHDRAKAEVQGISVHQEQHLDLTEVLERIKEMQRPPGQNIELPVQCKLEKFFHGGRKELQRKRTVKDFYQGMITEQHTYRAIVPRGAAEPYETVFKEQGDWHTDTKPDTITMLLSSKPHPTVERQGGDLLVKEELVLSEDVAKQPRLVADVPSLRGRHALFWGQNPLLGAAAGAQMELSLLSEGLAETGSLRVRCRVGGSGSSSGSAAGPAPPTYSREAARQALKDACDVHDAWKSNGGPLSQLHSRLATKLGCGEQGGAATAFRWLSAALQQVTGEWALIARANEVIAAGEGQSPTSLGAFLKKHNLTGNASLDEDEEESGESWLPSAESAARRGAEEEGPALRRRREADAARLWKAELRPLGAPTSLFTSPSCAVAFFANTEPLVGPAGRLPAYSLFALCLSSAACGRKRMAAQWEALRAPLLPLLESTAFLQLPLARQTLPKMLADFAARAGPKSPTEPPAPWKRLADAAFAAGDYFVALGYYGKCLEEPGVGEDLAAKVHSNRAACLAKVGAMEESLAEARLAREKKPEWGRAWSRVALALSQLGEEHKAEAFEASLKAVELQPCMATAEALAAAARAAREPGMEGAQAAREEGNAAYRKRLWGVAVARYTVALALTPEGEEATPLRGGLHSNRSAAFSRLRAWTDAVADGRSATAALPVWAKAHNRLGTALLGAGETEQAYTEFAWALLIENGNGVARAGQEASLCCLPSWHSVPAKKRLERFAADLGRPREATRIFAISDLHYDYKPNEEWVHRLDDLEYRDDVLIVAGNVANTHYTASKALRTLKSKFRRVFYVPGNEDVWMNPGEVHNSRFPDSFAKFLSLLETCDELGVDVFPAAVCSDVCVVPLFSWYNAQFDKKSRPDPNYMPDETCVWPLDAKEELWKYMLKLNESLVEMQKSFRGTVLSFSHFLPLATLPFSTDGNIRAGQSMGCEDIEDSIRLARSSLHVYGHSWLQASEDHGGILFVNRFHGFAPENPSEGPPPPLCIFDGKKGIVVSDSRREGDGGAEGDEAGQ